MIRLFLLEDDPRLVTLLEAVIRQQPDFEWVGHSASVIETLRTVDFSGVDLLLADLDLGEESGVALIGAVAAVEPRVISLVHTVHDDRESLFAALRAGARGYVLKGQGIDDLLGNLRSASQGHVPLSPAVARFLIDQFRGEPRENATDQQLSDREVEILRQVADGMTYKEIASRLSISPHTVHNHVKRIYEKLHAANRQEAVRTATRLGYLGRRGGGRQLSVER
ncbi:MAG: LuxR C-terminal-related transcriptional regulator [Verrucomicrobiota bacterium]